MNVLEAIKTRKSIRKYKEKEIPEELLKQMLEAGFCAPSAHNQKPWNFIVITDRKILSSFAEYGTYQKMLYTAPMAIMICGNENTQPNHDLLINDCSAATENILLAAHGLELGAVWCGIVQENMIAFSKKQLDLPDNILPVALVAVGYADEERTVTDRYNEQHIFYNKYENK